MMKFKVGDQVLVTMGKDKGKKGPITKVFPVENKVLVDGVNLYTRHVKKFGNQAGQKMVQPRPMATAKVAIINDQGAADRIGYRFTADGKKERIYKKTGVVIIDQAVAAKKADKKDKKATKEAKKETKKAPAKKSAK